MTTLAWGTHPEMFGPRHEYRLGMILREIEKVPRGARVLDAAVGLGQLAGRMKQDGYAAIGIDSAFAAALHAHRTAGIPTVVGDLTRMPFRDGAFDGATTGETLEHLDDDAAGASEIGRVLRDGGRVVATVPALQSLWSQWDDYYEHRRRYARSQLADLFRRAGLRIVTARFWGFPIGLVYERLVLLPMNKRRARVDIDEDAALGFVARAGKSRLLVNVVRGIFSLDALFRWVPYGPGLLLVATKKQE